MIVIIDVQSVTDYSFYEVGTVDFSVPSWCVLPSSTCQNVPASWGKKTLTIMSTRMSQVV